MHQISDSEVTARITPQAALNAVRAAHQDLALGSAQNVVRARARSGSFTLHSLPAVSKSLGLSGIKIYTSVGGMKASHLLLYRIASGELLAMIEAQELGRLRTAAAAVLGVELLSGSKLEKVLVIGSGYQGEGIVRALAAEQERLGVQSISITARDIEKTRANATLFSSRYNTEVIATPSPLGDFQTIFTATTSQIPVLTADQLRAVRQISALGSNSLMRRELDPKILSAAKEIVVDDIEVAKVECGNLLPLIESGRIAWNQVRDLGRVQSEGTRPGDGHSLFLSHGMGVQDLYLGALLL